MNDEADCELSEYAKMKNREAEWLASLKSGDAVAVMGGYRTAVLRIDHVARVTATQVILVNVNGYATRFAKKNASMIGGANGYYRTYIAEVTPEIHDQLERKELLLWWSSVKDKDLTLPLLRQMKITFNEHTKEVQ